MTSMREQIDEIMVDCYTEEEQRSAWGVAFEDNVKVPFQASLLDMPVTVQGFRVSDGGCPQCQVLREKKERWVGVEDLDEESLPTDYRDMLKLYGAWVNGDY